jgi:hypothetical protein
MAYKSDEWLKTGMLGTIWHQLLTYGANWADRGGSAHFFSRFRITLIPKPAEFFTTIDCEKV